MSDEQLYRLSRTFWVCAGVTLSVTMFTIVTMVDVLFWESWITAWVTPENFLPVMFTLAGLSVPFWILGGLAERKMSKYAEEQREEACVCAAM